MISAFVYPPSIIRDYVSGASLTWTNMPAALTELNGSAQRRFEVDLTKFNQWRLHLGIGTSAAAGGVIGAQFSNDSGTTWFGMDNGTSGSNSTVTVAFDAGAGSYRSAYATLAAAARISDALIRIVGVGGDGVVDPTTPMLAIEFRMR